MRTLFEITAAMLFVLLASDALAQGYMVRPMRLEASPRPSTSVDIPVQVWNTSGDGERIVALRLVELYQNPSGGWRLVEPDSAEALGEHASALGWTSLRENRLTIDPLQPMEFHVRINPPADARGAYFVGVVVEEPKQDGATGITVRTRFLIPLIVQIQGRAVRQRIAIRDALLTYGENTEGVLTTSAFLQIENAGRSYSRLKGSLRIERKDGDTWRSVSTFALSERSIIPGMTLQLGQDLKRRLPSGEYRIHGELLVDGRRITPIERVLQFEGDDSGSALAFDAQLVLDPRLIDVSVVPGATRTTVLSVGNPTNGPIRVRIDSITPRSLIGVEMGTMRGDELSAQAWTSVRPSEFTLRPGGRQSVRVVGAVPRAELPYPNYYADLVLTATYPDGQSAGETRSTIRLKNAAAGTISDGMVDSMSISQSDASNFIVQMRFVNTGNVHLQPSATASLLDSKGTLVARTKLEGADEPLLPLGKQDFSGELSFSDVDPGYYTLRYTVTLSSGMDVVRQILAFVDVDNINDAAGTSPPTRSVTLLDPTTGPLPDGIELAPGATQLSSLR